jgi:hypothetical protein
MMQQLTADELGRLVASLTRPSVLGEAGALLGCLLAGLAAGAAAARPRAAAGFDLVRRRRRRRRALPRRGAGAGAGWRAGRCAM